MTLLEAMGQLISKSWGFFTEITIPGVNFTFAQLFVGLFLAGFSLRVLALILGLSFSSDEVIAGLEKFGSAQAPGSSLAYRSGSSRSTAIAEERRNDQF